jgi:hypothetical protein
VRIVSLLPSGTELLCALNRYFNRSGPTVFQTIPLIAELLHPETFPRQREGRDYRRWR